MKSGEIQVGEIGNQIPGQMSIEDIQAPQPSESMHEVDGRVVDVETGEIQEERPEKVIDLRKKA